MKELLQDLLSPVPNTSSLNVVPKSYSLFSCGLVSPAYLLDSFYIFPRQNG